MARKPDKFNQEEEGPRISDRRVTGWLEPLNTAPIKRKTDLLAENMQIKHYQVVPAEVDSTDGGDETVWRIVLEPIGINSEPLALEIHSDIVLGSDASPENDLDVNLISFDGWMRGVSRRHIMLRPSKTKLFIMDLRSTNGTQINGLPLGVGWAYALKQGDVISLAKLNLTITITGKP